MELYTRVIKIADLLGLGLWHLKIDERPEDEGAAGEYAEVDIDGDGGLEARITFYKPYYALEPYMQLQVIVHELLHCVFAPVDEMIESMPELIRALAQSCSKTQDSVSVKALASLFCEQFEQNYNERTHRLLDGFARSVVLINEMGLER